MGLDHPLAYAALREVVGLHAFFEAWLGGTAENTLRCFPAWRAASVKSSPWWLRVERGSSAQT
jgi:hypothetical protein